MEAINSFAVAAVTNHPWNGFAANERLAIVKPLKVKAYYIVLGWDQHGNSLEVKLTHAALEKAVIYGYLRFV